MLIWLKNLKKWGLKMGFGFNQQSQVHFAWQKSAHFVSVSSNVEYFCFNLLKI
jgi:hypothetical protein